MGKIFYKFLKSISDIFLKIGENFLKQWLGTVVGMRVLKFVTDFIVKKLFKEVAEPFMRVAVIRAGYYYDLNDAQNKIEKLENAEEQNNEELYIRTLNDILRK